jgi:hypothetical protein
MAMPPEIPAHPPAPQEVPNPPNSPDIPPLPPTDIPASDPPEAPDISPPIEFPPTPEELPPDRVWLN